MLGSNGGQESRVSRSVERAVRGQAIVEGDEGKAIVQLEYSADSHVLIQPGWGTKASRVECDVCRCCPHESSASRG